MFTLTQEQVEFISADIRARGISVERLHDSLLDHVCCVLEEQMDDEKDFRTTYEAIIRTFYKDQLWEIEEQTLLLLTDKNYYLMKKAMIISGTLSAAILATGIIFKFLFWPGAGPLVVTGLLSSCFLFLPILFSSEVRGSKTPREKLAFGLGTVQLFLVSLHVLFKLMHWPFVMPLFYAAIGFLFLVYIPIYFFTGYRNEQTRLRTVSYTVQLVICGCLFLALYRAPKAARMQSATNTTVFANSEQLLNNERQLLSAYPKRSSANTEQFLLGEKIYTLCAELKSFILKCETGHEHIPADFEEKEAFIHDSQVGPFFDMDDKSLVKLRDLTNLMREYNSLSDSGKRENLEVLPAAVIMDLVRYERSTAALNMLTQIQWQVLQSERALTAQR